MIVMNRRGGGGKGQNLPRQARVWFLHAWRGVKDRARHLVAELVGQEGTVKLSLAAGREKAGRDPARQTATSSFVATPPAMGGERSSRGEW